MGEVIVKIDDETTTWKVSDGDATMLVGVFKQSFKGAEPPVTVTGVETLDTTPTILAPLEDLIGQLKMRQHQACAYGTTEGDARTCDCKYTNRMFLGDAFELKGEQTGCCELRAAIQILEKLRG